MLRTPGIRCCGAGLVLAITCLVAASTATARELSYRFFDAELTRVDLDKDGTVVNGSETVTLNTDDDLGYRVAGAWELPWNIHVYGEYGKAKNDVGGSVSNPGVPDVRVSDEIDLTRARVGIGYDFPLRERLSLYGRLTYDYIDVDNVKVGSITLGDDDDTGLGVEGGVRWLLIPYLELQGYGRYSEVGELDIEEGFDDDVLGGVVVRWNAFGAEELAFQMGYEFGDTNTLSLGLRFIF